MKARTHMVGALAGLLMSALAQSGVAQPAAPVAGVWSLQVGQYSDLNRVAVNYESRPLWSHQFARSRLDLVGELGVSYWHSRDNDKSHGNAWQFSAIPMFQWWLTPRFYLEAGIGATVFTHTRLADRDLATAFQFGDHIGMGFQLNEQVRLTLRASHFSNAGLKEPNDGVNMLHAGMTVRW